MEYAIGYIIGGIIISLIFGFITKYMNESKGYEGGFWWGFFLDIIGVIVVACKPQNITVRSDYATFDHSLTQNNQYIPKPSGNASAETKTDDTAKNDDLLSKLEQLHAQGILDDEEFRLKSRELRLDADTRKKIQDLNDLADKGAMTWGEVAQKKEALIVQAEAHQKKISALNNLKEVYKQGLIGKEEYMAKWKAIAGNTLDAASALEQNLSELENINSACNMIQYIKSDPVLNDAIGMDDVMEHLEKMQKIERVYGASQRSLMNYINNYIKARGLTYTFSVENPPVQCPNCGQSIHGEVDQCAQCGATFTYKN